MRSTSSDITDTRRSAGDHLDQIAFHRLPDLVVQELPDRHIPPPSYRPAVRPQRAIHREATGAASASAAGSSGGDPRTRPRPHAPDPDETPERAMRPSRNPCHSRQRPRGHRPAPCRSVARASPSSYLLKRPSLFDHGHGIRAVWRSRFRPRRTPTVEAKPFMHRPSPPAPRDAAGSSPGAPESASTSPG